MLSPKRTKYRKQHKGRIHGAAKGGTNLNFGAFGLKAMERRIGLTARQIEAARRAMTCACVAPAACGSGCSRRTGLHQAGGGGWAAAKARRSTGSAG